MSKITIAIDGPAGAGKSTVAKLVAKRTGLRFLDTGAMYRALALKAQRQGFGPDDGDTVGAIGESTEISFQEGDPQRVILDGEDVTDLIRTPEIGELASALSAYTPVRRVLAAQQRDIVAGGGYTLEGRDTTTVTAPHAEVKVFLTASLAERAGRRYRELVERGLSANPGEVQEMIEERDARDTNRADSPLRVADDAHEIWTDGLTVEEVVDKIVALARAQWRKL